MLDSNDQKIEVVLINQSLKTKSTTTPKLLIKDDKNPNTNVKFPTRMVITTTIFTSNFRKSRISWSESTSWQSSGKIQNTLLLKHHKWRNVGKNLERKIERVTIVSIDGLAMYPSIKFTLVKKSYSILHTDII